MSNSTIHVKAKCPKHNKHIAVKPHSVSQWQGIFLQLIKIKELLEPIFCFIIEMKFIQNKHYALKLTKACIRKNDLPLGYLVRVYGVI